MMNFYQLENRMIDEGFCFLQPMSQSPTRYLEERFPNLSSESALEYLIKAIGEIDRKTKEIQQAILIERDYTLGKIVRVKGEPSAVHPITLYGRVENLSFSKEFVSSITEVPLRKLGSWNVTVDFYACLEHLALRTIDPTHKADLHSLVVTERLLRTVQPDYSTVLEISRFLRGAVIYHLSAIVTHGNISKKAPIGYRFDQLEAVTPDEFLADFVKYMALDSGRFDSGFIFR